ncbi:hypothetical protein BJ742DRAFT_35086 [Cladochytrium replicatum]|nr:hypothetical protein BJ742DRAFT_35086 [Cladochytrium replicatum]
MGVAGEGTLPAAAGGDGAAGAIAELAVPFTYAIPFAVLLLGIAIIPLFKPHLWEKWYGLYGVLCSVAFVIPFAVEYGVLQAIYELLHSFFLDYLPFITLIFALYVTAGGIVVEGTLSGSPLVNTVLLLVAAPLASLIGTTGASMLLVRPLIRSVSHRVYQRHTVVFFIFIASNVAGALTPIGDPPVYLGFLKGVDFFWPLLNVWGPTLLVFGMLLLAYYSLDLWLYRREKALNLPHHHHHDDDDESEPASDEEEEIVEVTAEGQKSEDVEDQKQERKLEAADSTQDSDGMKTITSGSETTSTSTEITPNPNDMHDVVRSPVATVAHSSEGSPPPEPPQSYRPLRLFPLRQADEEHSLKSRPSMNGSLRSENQSLNSLESGNVRVSRSSSRRSSHSSARHSHHSRRSSHHSKPASVLHEVIEAVMGEDEEVEENGADSDTWSEVESVELPKRWGMPVWVEGWVNVGLTLAVVVVVVTSGYLKKTFEDYGFYVMKDPHDPSHGM